MKRISPHTIVLGLRCVDYRLVNSKTARKIRIRVGPNGVEVIKPAAREPNEVAKFLRVNKPWILSQLSRMDRLGRIRRVEHRRNGEILFRGHPTKVRVEIARGRRRENQVFVQDSNIVIKRGARSKIPASRSLENWLRRQARQDIESCLTAVTQRLKRQPNRVYIMNQRTKWGGCSRKRNLSFNWRLILAPRQVLQYLVMHEAVHLAVLDHSARFWLILRSLCPHAEQSRAWLATHGDSLIEFRRDENAGTRIS